MTLAEARKALGRLKLERERGVDPQLQKQQVRTEARRKREAEKLASYTVESLIEDFVAEKLSKQKRGAEGARLLRRDLLPKLGDRAAAGLTRRELQDEVIRPMLKRAPRGGTYLLSRIRCAYAHAAEQGRIPDDFVFPTLGIKGAPQVRRKRAFILNHVDSSVSAIYDRHRYDAEARVWLQKWADYLQSLTVRNVVPLRAA